MSSLAVPFLHGFLLPRDFFVLLVVRFLDMLNFLLAGG